MPVVEIKKDIYWVGVVDWNIHDFHGYSRSPQGTTYNAYLVMDDKITLFDSVPAPFQMDLYHQIRSLIPLEKIDYIVCNHIEPDHAGAMPFLMDKTKPEKVFCSKMGHRALLDHFHQPDWPYHPVQSGDSISLGKRTVHFMETRMLHWPDSMFSYLAEDKLLISNDAFGQNIASSQRFDDEVDLPMLMDLSSHYYHNIVLPYSNRVTAVLNDVAKLGLEIDMIAPDHGLIWRSHVDTILKAYRDYAEQRPHNKAVIVYDTMWQSTEKMAKAIAEGVMEEGVAVKIMHLKEYHHSDVMGELATATGIICGSPTHNNGIMPLVANFLTYMQGLRPLGRVGAAFGSFGWSGEGVNTISDWLKTAKVEVVEPGVKVKNVPNHEKLAECKELGRQVAKAIKAKIEAAQ
ncbi:MAG: FprA family A-type flavoprotein [Desulfomicrobium sp.]|nr:FprA family A-type flavoprotein [Desulfomicrobium sp.]NLV96049.1 FprA family A-type flavoprotein [Desulfovibrionales bacterium]